MKIENNTLNPLMPKKTGGAYPVEKNTRSVESSKSVGEKDRAEFSGQARILAKARAAMDEAPEVRSSRIAEIRSQIESGSYQPPLEEVATKLLPLFKGS